MHERALGHRLFLWTDLVQGRTDYSNPVEPPANEPADQRQLFGTLYKAGPKAGVQSHAMDPADLREILKSIRNRKQYADFAIATIHTHQDQSVLQRFHYGDHPPDFLIELARKSIGLTPAGTLGRILPRAARAAQLEESC